MKNQINITISGIGFNCEVAARYTEDEFVNRHMPTKLPNTPVREREIILRQAHQICLKKLSTVNGGPIIVQNNEGGAQDNGKPAGSTGEGDTSSNPGDGVQTGDGKTGNSRKTGSKQTEKEK